MLHDIVYIIRDVALESVFVLSGQGCGERQGAVGDWGAWRGWWRVTGRPARESRGTAAWAALLFGFGSLRTDGVQHGELRGYSPIRVSVFDGKFAPSDAKRPDGTSGR